MKGTLDVLVLEALSQEPMHGYGVSRWIGATTQGILSVEEAALYQALHRMERRGWLESEWGRSEKNRRAKFYSLTDMGWAQLEHERGIMARYVRALTLALGLGAGGASS
ncbi:MAG: PadR family transcriptional regulator [Gemmatimonadetes bacterium]|nr:PadR family transcriptional regulator [Gemmatimonadota bacterium]